jgi:hypothetical protein
VGMRHPAAPGQEPPVEILIPHRRIDHVEDLRDQAATKRDVWTTSAMPDEFWRSSVARRTSGHQLAEMRKASGLMQADVAKTLGFPRRGSPRSSTATSRASTSSAPTSARWAAPSNSWLLSEIAAGRSPDRLMHRGHARWTRCRSARRRH